MTSLYKRDDEPKVSLSRHDNSRIRMSFFEHGVRELIVVFFLEKVMMPGFSGQLTVAILTGQAEEQEHKGRLSLSIFCLKSKLKEFEIIHRGKYDIFSLIPFNYNCVL